MAAAMREVETVLRVLPQTTARNAQVLLNPLKRAQQSLLQIAIDENNIYRKEFYAILQAVRRAAGALAYDPGRGFNERDRKDAIYALSAAVRIAKSKGFSW